jgi:hypothetical protein
MRKLNSANSKNLATVRRFLVSLILTAILMTTVIAQSSEKRSGGLAKTDATEVSGTDGQRPIADENIMASAPNAKPTDLTGSWNGGLLNPSERTPTSKVLFTFNSDGGLIVSLQARNQSAVHGVWQKTGNRQYVFKAVTIGNGSGENLQEVTIIQGNVTLNDSADHFSLTLHVDSFDQNGVLVGTQDGTGQADRIKLP